MPFITDRHKQTITINGTVYQPADSMTENGKPSRLQSLFREKYGTDSFHARLADFLTEWFNASDRLKVHTSGSTGKPKELWVEKERMMNSAMLTVSFLRIQPHDTALLCMPLQYIAGKMVVVRALVAGLNLIPVNPSGHPLKDLAEAPSFAALIPMQVFNSLAVREENELLQQTRHLIIGGGAIDRQMEETLRRFPNSVWSTYGMTETLSHIALRKLSGPEASGWYTPFKDVTVSLSDENTLIIRAPRVNEETLTTNDIAELNPKGQFRIIGRKDNTINTGGVKVQIEQIEEALHARLSLPFMITAVPDPKFGERIVMLTEGEPQMKEIEKAVSTLPPYWRPKQVFKTEKLPQTGTGKPDRAEARRLAEDIAARI